MARSLVVLLVLLVGGCLPAWPLGDPAPGVGFSRDDDDATADDDDATADDDDATADDDDATADDDDATADDDDTTADDDDATGDDDDATGDDDDATDPPLDSDNDGWPDDQDCDDVDGTINPGAAEIHCDLIDQDCTGVDLCDVCSNATTVGVPLLDGALWSEAGSLGSPDELYFSQANGPYFFRPYFLNMPLLTAVSVTYSSSDYGVWIETYDNLCVRQDTDGGEFEATANVALQTWVGAQWTVVVSSYLPLETGSFTLDVENTGSF